METQKLKINQDPVKQEEFEKFIADFTSYAKKNGCKIDPIEFRDLLEYYFILGESYDKLLEMFRKFKVRWDTLKGQDLKTNFTV